MADMELKIFLNVYSFNSSIYPLLYYTSFQMSACVYAVVFFEEEGSVGMAHKTWIESQEDVSIIKNVLVSAVD